MKKIMHVWLILFGLVPLAGFGQSIGKIKKSEKSYENFGYAKTSEILLEQVNKGHESAELFQTLADAFFFQSKMKEAAQYYGVLMQYDHKKSIEPVYYLRYAQALKGIANYAESDVWMKKYAQVKGVEYVAVEEFLANIEVPLDDFVVENLSINSPYSDFGAVLYKDQLIFSSARGGGKIHEWNNQPYLNLYKSQVKKKDGSLSEPEILSGEVNSRFHESSATLSANGRVMYFTRNTYHGKKSKKVKGKTNTLGIFRAELVKGNWTKVTPMPFNSDVYNVAHPSLSADGSKLYFCSDMPGSFGGSDIYVVDIKKNGTTGSPQNLGPLVNTTLNETFPFVSKNGDLYFSSNGRPGYGGLDIYVIKADQLEKMIDKGSEGLASKAGNDVIAFNDVEVDIMAAPINSPADDFAFFIFEDGHTGYFSSNREGGKGDDDIYSFSIAPCRSQIDGIVQDRETNQPLAGSLVLLFDEEGQEISRVRADEEARFSFGQMACKVNFKVVASKDRYLADSSAILALKGNTNHLELKLEPEFVVEEEKIMIRVNTIYFDYDDHAIRDDAAKELDKVVEAMKKYPHIVIEAGSHTDDRGSVNYNEQLSGRRARSAAEYIISKGIDPSRVSSRGYGKSQLKVNCGSNCSEEDHQLNRRTEFVVMNSESLEVIDSTQENSVNEYIQSNENENAIE
jgi:outer membrane protein OmpA-like peptidoglycan-associated protein